MFFGDNKSKTVKLDRAKNLKKEIEDYSRGTSNGITASNEVKTKIGSVVKELEQLNFENNLTSNIKLDGKWKLLYTTNSGSSAGKLGPFVGRVNQDITVGDSLYYNYVRLGPGLVEGVLSATWDVIDKKTWRVQFVDIAIKVLGIQVTKKSLEGSVGTWRMTYLDDTIRILYAKGGKNTEVENIYILKKE